MAFFRIGYTGNPWLESVVIRVNYRVLKGAASHFIQRFIKGSVSNAYVNLLLVDINSSTAY
jgi:hypothetical protein